MLDFHEFSPRQLKNANLKDLIPNRNMEDHLRPIDFRCSEESTNRADFKGCGQIGSTRLHVEDPPRPPFACIDSLAKSESQYDSDCADLVALKSRNGESPKTKKASKDTFSGCQGGVPRDYTQRRRRRRRHARSVPP